MRFKKNPLRMLDCKEPQDQAKIAAAPKMIDYLCKPCREHFAAVQRFLKMYDMPFEIDPLIVRGLDYYTRTVFEFMSDVDKLALNGGGRYDGLVVRDISYEVAATAQRNGRNLAGEAMSLSSVDDDASAP